MSNQEQARGPRTTLTDPQGDEDCAATESLDCAPSAESSDCAPAAESSDCAHSAESSDCAPCSEATLYTLSRAKLHGQKHVPYKESESHSWKLSEKN